MLASLTSSVTSFVADHGLYAVFVLMLAAAVVPTASELVMLYGGALASGAFASAHVTAFGHRIHTPVWAYLAVVLTGVVANALAGVGWAVGSSYERVHGDLRYVDAAAVVLVVLAAAVLLRRRRRSSGAGRRFERS